jgi:hypothetical protein
VNILISLLIGVGLSATSGFRVFIPFLIMSIASITGFLELAPGFDWIGSYPALIAFTAAALLEVLAYFFPLVDNLLSVVSAPVTVIAGTLITASVFFELGPLVTWVVAFIAGGGSALAGKATSAAVHAGSTAATGGTANLFVSFLETLWSFLLAVLAVVIPVLAGALLIALTYITFMLLRKFRRRTPKPSCSPR